MLSDAIQDLSLLFTIRAGPFELHCGGGCFFFKGLVLYLLMILPYAAIQVLSLLFKLA